MIKIIIFLLLATAKQPLPATAKNPPNFMECTEQLPSTFPMLLNCEILEGVEHYQTAVKPVRETLTAVKLHYNDMSKPNALDTMADIPYTTDQIFLKCSLSNETQKPLFLNCGLWENQTK